MGRRRKHRTHVRDVDESGRKPEPRSLVFRRGRDSSSLKELESDLRNVMMPGTAKNLKHSSKNVLKDFVQVAGPLGVTHFVMLSRSERGIQLSFARAPQGPTVTFRVRSYALMRDVARSQSRYRAPQTMWQHAPLVVLNNFQGTPGTRLAADVVRNAFPPVDVQNAKLSACQRVILMDADPDAGVTDTQRERSAEGEQGEEREGRGAGAREEEKKGRGAGEGGVSGASTDSPSPSSASPYVRSNAIRFRMYSIAMAPSGVSKGVKTLARRAGEAPDLGGLADVADLVGRGGAASDSEGEEAEASRVRGVDERDAPRGARGAAAVRVRLHEVGPRMDLELLRVQEGLCDGRVLFHAHRSLSDAEQAAQQSRHDAKEALRKRRRLEQEENVRRKAAEKKARTPEPAGDAAARPGAPSHRAQREGLARYQNPRDAGNDSDDDLQYYREEVGEEPDQAMLQAAQNRKLGRSLRPGLSFSVTPLVASLARRDTPAAPADTMGFTMTGKQGQLVIILIIGTLLMVSASKGLIPENASLFGMILLGGYARFRLMPKRRDLAPAGEEEPAAAVEGPAASAPVVRSTVSRRRRA